MKVRFSQDKRSEDAEWFRKKAETDKVLPDMIVLGPSNIILPYVAWEDASLAYITPFNMPPATHMIHTSVPGLAFGVGISSLLFALDTILLDKMPWQAMVRDALVTTNPNRMTAIADLAANFTQEKPPGPAFSKSPENML